MGEVVFRAILIWCICAVKVSTSEDVDYWYSNDDGLRELEIPSAYHFRGHHKDKTNLKVNLVRQYNYNSTQEDQKRNLVRLFNIDSANLRNGAQSLRTNVKQDSVIQALQRRITAHESQTCTDGPIKVMDCNVCLCMGGQLYICTVKRCSAHNSYNTYETVLVIPPVCIDGENVRSFDCNRCWCVGGAVYCTKKHCITLSSWEDEKPCIPGIPIPSPDGCNTCGCDNRGEAFCSAKSCGHRPEIVNDGQMVCVPETWYSLQDSKTCKECYCSDGNYAFCYMSLCAAEKSLGYSPVKLMAKQTRQCKKGDILKDRCTHCFCTFREEWKCYTRLDDTCSEKETKPTTASKNKPDSPVKLMAKQTDTGDSGDNGDDSNNEENSDNAPLMPTGSACPEGAYFTQSLQTTCQGCFCTDDEWKCFSVASPCNGYDDRKCKPGKYLKNRFSPCSVCMCGADGTYICATDENCANKLKRPLCKVSACWTQCVKKGRIVGFCHQDKCICA